LIINEIKYCYCSKSRSRRSEVSVSFRCLEVSENGHVSAVCFIFLWNYFSIQICRKQSCFM